MHDYNIALTRRIELTGSNLCVGMDLSGNETSKQAMMVMEHTAPFAAAFKFNSAFYERRGWSGFHLLEMLFVYARELGVPTILDVKRGDIGETQKMYAKAAFEVFKADAVTLNPYMGFDSIEPFLWEGKGIYLLGITSNKGAEDIQLRNLGLEPDKLPPTTDKEARSRAKGRLFGACYGMDHKVCHIVMDMAVGANLGLVAGLTNLDKVSLPDVPLLIPGLGAQGGDMEALDRTKHKAPFVVNVSRGILYPDGAERELTHGERAANWSRIINPQGSCTCCHGATCPTHDP